MTTLERELIQFAMGVTSPKPATYPLASSDSSQPIPPPGANPEAISTGQPPNLSPTPTFRPGATVLLDLYTYLGSSLFYAHDLENRPYRLLFDLRNFCDTAIVYFSNDRTRLRDFLAGTFFTVPNALQSFLRDEVTTTRLLAWAWKFAAATEPSGAHPVRSLEAIPPNGGSGA